MRTSRSLTVCRSLLPGVVSAQGGGRSAPRGVSALGGVCSWGCVCSGGVSALGVSAVGGVCSRGCVCSGGSAPGGVSALGVSAPGGGSAPRGVCSRGRVWYPSMHWGRHPPLWTESHTPVKTLPWPNFVAAGKNRRIHYYPIRKRHWSLCTAILVDCPMTYIEWYISYFSIRKAQMWWKYEIALSMFWFRPDKRFLCNTCVR